MCLLFIIYGGSMGRSRDPEKNKDVHIRISYELYLKLQDYLEKNPQLNKTMLLTRLLEEFFKYKGL